MLLIAILYKGETMAVKNNSKLLPLLLTIFLFTAVPFLVLAMSRSTENRSKAAYTACTITVPCVGTVVLYESPKVGYYMFVAVDGVTYIFKSLKFDVSVYVNKKIGVVGNIVSGTPPVLYADQVVPIPTPAPLPTPASEPVNFISAGPVEKVYGNVGRTVIVGYKTKVTVLGTPKPLRVFSGEPANCAIKVIGAPPTADSSAVKTAFTSAGAVCLGDGVSLYDFVFSSTAVGQQRKIWAIFHNDGAWISNNYFPNTYWSKPVSTGVMTIN